MLDYLITAHLQSTPLLAQRTHRDEAVECAGVDVGGRGVVLQHRLVHLGVRSKVKLVLTDRPPQEVTECSEYLDNIQGIGRSCSQYSCKETGPTCVCCVLCVCVLCVCFVCVCVCVFVRVCVGREKSVMQVACYRDVTRPASFNLGQLSLMT